MATLLLYDERRRSFTIEALTEQAQMPYITHLRFSVADFCHGARTELVWTSRSALEALDRLAAACRVPFRVHGGFRRIETGLFPFGAPQYAGHCFHCRALRPIQAARLSDAVAQTGAFPRFSPPFASGSSVSVWMPCRTRLSPGDFGTDVLSMQDALLLMGFSQVTLSGGYDEATRKAVRRLQFFSGLPADGRFGKAEAAALYQLTSAYQRAKMINRSVLCTEETNGLS